MLNKFSNYGNNKIQSKINGNAGKRIGRNEEISRWLRERKTLEVL
jgi:hypothetical protein